MYRRSSRRTGSRDGKRFKATRRFSTTLRPLHTEAMNHLRLAGFASIREGLQALMHKIMPLLALARRKPEASP